MQLVVFWHIYSPMSYLPIYIHMYNKGSVTYICNVAAILLVIYAKTMKYSMEISVKFCWSHGLCWWPYIWYMYVHSFPIFAYGINAIYMKSHEYIFVLGFNPLVMMPGCQCWQWCHNTNTGNYADASNDAKTSNSAMTLAVTWNKSSC